MEALVKQKVLSQLVNSLTPETSIVQPINIDVENVNVNRIIQAGTMVTNDENYFIRYGGFSTSGSYNAIEVYSLDSIKKNQAVYIFDNITIQSRNIQIRDLKQDEDGRFYGIGRAYDGTNYYNYLIIFNNFIQDGNIKINKYYSASTIGVTDGINVFTKVAKKDGVYFLAGGNRLIRFEINVLEGNQTSIATIIDGGTITSGNYTIQINIFKDKLIFTKLWETEDYQYEYTKAIVNINEEMPLSITLNRIKYLSLDSTSYIPGATNEPYEAIIPLLNATHIQFNRIDLNGEVTIKTNLVRTFNDNSSLNAYFKGNFASLTDGNNLYLFYFDDSIYQSNLIEFYNGAFSNYYSNTQILKQNNIINLIGTAVDGTQQSIVAIKNVYSPNVTSSAYYDKKFCIPYYLNLYSNSNDNTSLIFSRDATTRFYSGNQITSTFIVPNYLLNDGVIKKASVYGQTNYLLNNVIKDYQKNQFESLYFNFIYNLNVIDNTNNLNTLNQNGSNRISNSLWNKLDVSDTRLTKARITYEDLSTEIINLTIPTVTGTSVTFSYNVSGNITKIEYLSNDESVVYATFRTNLTGTNTITQTIRVE